MNKLAIVFILLSVKLFSQTSFNVIYEADYKLQYKLLNIPNAKIEEAAFALLINEKESYFKNMNKYIGDSLRYEKKLDDNNSSNGKYFTFFRENIGTTDGKIYVTAPIANKNFKYEETNDINWKLVNEYKTIGKYKTQKATTKKYGRTWIAWFAKDIPFPFGPYKFNKLPGLILEVYDDNNDYHYTLYKFGKRKYLCKSANMNTEGAKFVEKTKIFDYQRKEIADQNQFNDYIEDKETLNMLRKKSAERAKQYNPIELTIH
ncbi:GLPGLI family protein [Chryseobacterium sp. MEBOG06]|uniref:GLPGLI family protein n=1 Tax=Chryseobacterium sp. MEBOG06 TaxID=2879938 RepID=UPI001F161661|nr:GLPGLI family protein [Chryseobacterium sp. MEBOG06]UKB82328.1 GLPGLI family protein [Chryseobacterium sp. MEBOG06]